MNLCFTRKRSVLCFLLLYFLFIGDAFKAAVLTSNATPAAAPPKDTPVPAQSTSNNWTYIGTKAGIESYVKHIEGSNLLAFRGVAYIDAHISQAMGPFMNLSLSHEWVSMLKHIKQYPISNSTNNSTSDEDMVYQILELPWPLAPRDVLMHRKFTYDSRERTVTINYHSIEDARCPITAHRVRAHSPQSMWRFRSIPPCNSQQSLTATTSTQIASVGYLSKNSKFLRNIVSAGCRLMKPISQTGIFQVSMRFINSDALRRLPQRVCLSIKSSVSMPVRIVQGFGKRHARLPSPKAISSQSLQHQQSQLHNLAGLQCSPDCVKEDQAAKGAVCSQKVSSETRGCGRGVGTVVEFESFVDSKAAVPAWFINYMQRSFPAQALSAYKTLAAQQRTAPLDRVLDW